MDFFRKRQQIQGSDSIESKHKSEDAERLSRFAPFFLFSVNHTPMRYPGVGCPNATKGFSYFSASQAKSIEWSWIFHSCYSIFRYHM
jgi:hypothetical protein